MPIHVFNKHLLNIKNYNATAISSSYDHRSLLSNISNSDIPITIVSTPLNEAFIIYNFDEKYYIFGPFICNYINQKILNKILARWDIPTDHYQKIYNNLSDLSLFYLDDIKQLTYLISYIIDPQHKKVEHISSVKNFIPRNAKQVILDIDDILDLLQSHSDSSEIYKFETQLLTYVQKGKTTDVSKFLTDNDPAFSLNLLDDSFRAEKNYIIVLLEKLSHVAITSGINPLIALNLRNLFIKQIEECSKLNELYKTKNRAAILFTEKIADRRTSQLSAVTLNIIDYIDFNLHKSFRVKDIAEIFTMSETKLKTLFKKELNTSVHAYILQRKIKTAKKLLHSDIKIVEISYMLGFSDYTHFSKVFKRATGLTPKQFQQTKYY